MHAYVYIMYSSSLNKYYVGYTSDSIEGRMEKHIESYYGNKKYTSKTSDWILFLSFECASEKQARQIELHIKKMKSRVYIQNLKMYPEMIERLKLKYDSPGSSR